MLSRANAPAELGANVLADRAMRSLDSLRGAPTGQGAELVPSSLTGGCAAVSRNSRLAVDTTFGAGAVLPRDTRLQMEGAYGVDFSSVRVHTSGEGAEAAAFLNARALAYGEHIAFATGQFAPGTAQGDALLAHELGHTLQARRDGVAAPRADGPANGPPIDLQLGGNATYLTAQLISNPNPALLAALPEGQITEVPLNVVLGRTGLGSAVPSRSAREQGGVPWGPLVTVGGLETGEALAQYLGRYGFSSAGDYAAGLVAFPQSGMVRGTVDLLGARLPPRFGGSGPFLPGSRIMLGHTAVYVRQGGIITSIRSFGPQSLMEALTNFRAMRSGTGGVPGAFYEHLSSPFEPGGYVFDVPGARSVEWSVPREWTTALEEGLPRAGPRSGVPYVAQPEPGLGENCVRWAERSLSEGVSSQAGQAFRVGAEGGPPIVDISSRGRTVPGAARQQVLLDLMEQAGRGEATLSTASGMGEAVVGTASRKVRVVRFGGQLLMVAGLAYSGYRIASASPEERPRAIGEEVGGQAGGAAGFFGGMGTCVLLGIATEGWGLLACGVVGGVGGGLAGSHLGGPIGEAAARAPVAAVEWYTDRMLESPDSVVRQDAVALRRAVFNDDPWSLMYLMQRMAGY